MNVVKVCVCTELTKPIKTGYFSGFQCHYCHKELQATRTGRDRIQEGWMTVCNPCGFKIFNMAKEMGKTIDALFSPECEREVRRQLEQKDENN